MHKHLASYSPDTAKPSMKTVVAVCHGVMVLSETMGSDGKSIIHECDTTALPGRSEQVAFWGTRAFLGDYYKTYGAGSDNVETSVKRCLDNPDKQFVVVDEMYNYISARFPPDAKLLAEKTIALVQSSMV
ncbi:hypothetical protein EG329_013294 [Mollisiaceae sp. DMI_Dod_QoI]|nr:hypothetical protein EG329_013294 [Helotiales sp. DMI_Dod_QoI]